MAFDHRADSTTTTIAYAREKTTIKTIDELLFDVEHLVDAAIEC